ncbi:MAG: ABC transporter permease [Prevotellaceae bacterium]|jgi:hypothetical protein|nr:ABC transporter permease [Prevotellaceae bacterium]
MIRHLFTLLWNQRRQNGWLFAELTVVFIALWLLCDTFVARIYTYYQPLGFDIGNCWRLSFGEYVSSSSNDAGNTTGSLTTHQSLFQILERLRGLPEVEDACVAIYSSPYSNGTVRQGLQPVDADSARFAGRQYHMYCVSYDYFHTFRIRDKNGEPIDVRAHPERYNEGMMITPELERDFFGNVAGTGRMVMNGEVQFPVTGVTNSIRMTDFERPEEAMFQLYSDEEFQSSYFSNYTPNQLEVTVRMKRTLSQEQMDEFLATHRELLGAGNLYVIAAAPWTEWRDAKLSDKRQQLTVFALIGLFTLFTVFFGITGTFWLRVEQRRGETGLRMALGSSPRRIAGFFTAEGWLLLTAVLPLSLVVIGNLCYADLPDTSQMDMGTGRFLIACVTALLLLGVMILLGTWLPARRAMKMKPAEALHYE